MLPVEQTKERRHRSAQNISFYHFCTAHQFIVKLYARWDKSTKTVHPATRRIYLFVLYSVHIHRPSTVYLNDSKLRFTFRNWCGWLESEFCFFSTVSPCVYISFVFLLFFVVFQLWLRVLFSSIKNGTVDCANLEFHCKTSNIYPQKAPSIFIRIHFWLHYE